VTNENENPETPHEINIEEPEEIIDPLEKATNERDHFKSLAQRSQADLVNYRNRVTQESEEARRSVKFGILSRFISVADDMSRAIESIPEDADTKWSEGISLVMRNLENVFQIEGIEKIDSLNCVFDPNFHEALMYEETEDSEEGYIVSVIQEGYKIGTKILRPARVIVAKKPEVKQKQEEM
jgi:molecular chaperone GrpE